MQAREKEERGRIIEELDGARGPGTRKRQRRAERVTGREGGGVSPYLEVLRKCNLPWRANVPMLSSTGFSWQAGAGRERSGIHGSNDAARTTSLIDCLVLLQTPDQN